MRVRYKISILPMIVLVLYGLSVLGMTYSEDKVMNLYKEHKDVLVKLPNATPAEQKALTKDFAKDIKLSETQQMILNVGNGAQKILDRITPGRPHCLTSNAEECGVYDGAIITAAKERHNTILKLSGEEPQILNVLNGTPYTALDYFVKIMMLLIEAAILNIFILAIYLAFRRDNNAKDAGEKDKIDSEDEDTEK